MKTVASLRSVLASLFCVSAVVATAGVAAPGYAGAATPAPSPSCSSAPTGFTFTVSENHVQAGQPVTLTITYQQCGGGPEHHFTVSARPLSQSSPITTVGQVTTHAGETESASLTMTPERSTTYMAGEDGQIYSQLPSVDVTVDRTSGGCAGVVGLNPATGARGTTARLVGSAPSLEGDSSDTGTVTIMIRRRNSSAFQEQGRTRVPWDARGHFYSSLTLDDDYRMYASSARCDSPTVLALVHPSISGPATARRGTTLSLTVTGISDAPVQVWFRKRGTSAFIARRWGKTNPAGSFTTTYRPDDDYRYYALVGNDRRQSSTSLTQVGR